MIDYEIIASGSAGNAVLINKGILIDCGVPYKKIEPYIGDLKLVLLTHIHGDHFNSSTIHRIAFERPSVRFGCGSWLRDELISSHVKKANIDVMRDGLAYSYGGIKVIPVHLKHDVRNQGYKIHFPNGEKMIYATDTGSMDGIIAKNYDLYLVEANYDADDLQARIDSKMDSGEYIYEFRAKDVHLSKQKCDEWLDRNMGENGKKVYMHRHVDK